MTSPSLRRLYAVLAAASLWAACGGCNAPPDPGGGQSAGGEPRRGGQAVIATGNDFGGVNPVIVPSSVLTAEVGRQLFLPLVEEQPDYRTVEPILAESWEFSADHRVLTFHLRDGVTWSDGQPVTAEDVEFSFRAWTSPEIAWEGAYALELVERVEVVDPLTVRFHFERPYATQLLDVAAGSVILPKHKWGELPFADWQSHADWFREPEHFVVDGPYTLESWTPQQQIVLARNEAYYEEGLPRLDRVVLRVIPEPANQLTQLLGGEIDYVLQLSPDDVARVEAAPGARVISYWTRGYIAIGWNERRELFRDPSVRRALTLAIDRQTLVDSIWGDNARPLAGLVPEDVWAHNPEVVPLPYDPDEARRLLAAAGWNDDDGDGVRERGGEKLRIGLMTNTGNRPREDAVVLIQDQLRRVGVEVTADVLEFNTMIERAFGGEFDGLLFGQTLPTTFDFRPILHSDEIAEGSNIIAYSDPEVDRLLDEIREQPTLEDAQPLILRLQAIVQEQQPYTFLWQSKRLVGVSARLHDVEPNHLFNLWNLRQWWVDGEE